MRIQMVSHGYSPSPRILFVSRLAQDKEIGVNGFLVPPADPEVMANAMVRILADEPLAMEMGQASLSVARPHAEENTFDAYESLYRRLAGRQLPRHQPEGGTG